MRYPDLSLSTQIVLIALLAATASAVLTRALIFFRREWSGAKPSYPDTWTALQRRMLEGFRLLVGLGLAALWGAFLFLAPSLPTSAPFGLLEMIFMILLLLITHAWILFLTPRSLPRRVAFSSSFWVTMTVLAVWWLSALAATGWVMVRASTPPPPRALNGVFASLPTGAVGPGAVSLL